MLIGGFVALFIALYFSLLLWAILTGGGIVHGHPLAPHVLATELILLGAYWWTLQAADALAESVERAWGWIRRKSGVASYVT